MKNAWRQDNVIIVPDSFRCCKDLAHEHTDLSLINRYSYVTYLERWTVTDKSRIIPCTAQIYQGSFPDPITFEWQIPGFTRQNLAGSRMDARKRTVACVKARYPNCHIPGELNVWILSVFFTDRSPVVRPRYESLAILFFIESFESVDNSKMNLQIETTILFIQVYGLGRLTKT